MSQEEVNAKAKQAVLKYDANGAKAAAKQAIDEKLDLVSVINSSRPRSCTCPTSWRRRTP